MLPVVMPERPGSCDETGNPQDLPLNRNFSADWEIRTETPFPLAYSSISVRNKSPAKGVGSRVTNLVRLLVHRRFPFSSR